MPMFVDTTPPGQCIFCKLVAGDIPAARVYEDDLTLAFMDLGQVNPGHTLVTVKRHAETLLDLTPDEAAAAMRTAQRVAQAVKDAFDPPGLTLLQANGIQAQMEFSGRGEREPLVPTADEVAEPANRRVEINLR